VLPAARRFPDLGALPSGTELQLPASIEQAARKVQAPESAGRELPVLDSAEADATRRAA
jgi:hypothetical protein